jgi:hypothetical protein
MPAALPVVAAGPSTITVAGGAVTAGGGIAVIPQSPHSVTGTSGSCATPTACSSIGAITLVGVETTCLSGIVSGSPSSTLDIDLESLTIPGNEGIAGVRPSAYIGSLTLSDAGAFCAPAIPGVQMILATSSCSAGPITAASGGSGPTCGAGGCQDAGTISYCP